MKDMKVDENGWYTKATVSRAEFEWKSVCRDGLDNLNETIRTVEVHCEPVKCEICLRVFRRESDKKQHIL